MNTTDERLRQIAVEVIEDYAFNVDFVSILEMFAELSEEEAQVVFHLIIDHAVLKVEWK